MYMTTTHQGPQWYVAYTYPKFERKVRETLTRKNINAYLPLQKVTRQWSDRKKRIEVPIFPNYIFVNVLYNERFDILNVPGVVRFVTFGGSLAVISNEEIDSIQKLVTGNAEVELTTDFKEGDLVKMVTGPFAGLKGLLYERNNGTRFAVRIEGLSQIISIEVNTAWLEKVNNSTRVQHAECRLF
jgi:transcriptional antiterminator RfaH